MTCSLDVNLTYLVCSLIVKIINARGVSTARWNVMGISPASWNWIILDKYYPISWGWGWNWIIPVAQHWMDAMTLDKGDTHYTWLTTFGASVFVWTRDGQQELGLALDGLKCMRPHASVSWPGLGLGLACLYDSLKELPCWGYTWYPKLLFYVKIRSSISGVRRR